MHRSGMHFIVSTDVSKADADTRKLIRSHVMLGKNREKSRRTKRRAVTNGNANDTGPLVKWSPGLDTSYSKIPQRVGSDVSFTSLADQVPPILLDDVKNFFDISVRTLFPMAMFIGFDDNDHAWFDDLMFDAAYLHMTVFAAETIIDKVSPRPNQLANQKTMLHFLKGLQILRERLLFGDEEAISDSTIRVVLILTMSTYLMGEYDTAQHHMKGLSRIVNLRGGLITFRSKKLMMEILRCDIEMALHNGSEPMFFNQPTLEPFIPYPDENLLAFQLQIGMIDSPSNSENDFENIDQDLAMAWRVMQHFCTLANCITITQQKLSSRLLQDTMASVMYRLLYMKFEPGSVDEAMRLSLLGFSYHIFLQWQDMTLPHHHFPSSFKDCILNLETKDEAPSHLMLWLLFVGAITVFISSNETWLTQCIRRYVDICQVSSWDQMHDILKSYLWINLLHDKPGRDIFDSVFL